MARTGERKGDYRVWWENVREGDYWKYLGVHWRIILKWIFRQ
jgi:hypothetical protein